MSKVVIIVLSSLLLVAAIGAVAFGFATNWGKPTKEEEGSKRVEATNKAVQAMCESTDYKDACFKSLSGVQTDNPKELIKAAFESAKAELNNVAQNSPVMKELENNPKTAEAAKNCKELFQDANNDLQRSLDEIGQMEWNQAENMVGNLKSWLSASITYQDTCLDGFDNTTGDASDKVKKLLETSMQMSSNGLAIISDMSSLLVSLEPSSLARRRLLEAKNRRLLSQDNNDDPTLLHDDEPDQRRRRRLLRSIDEEVMGHDHYDELLPIWLVDGTRRRLLEQAATNLGDKDLKSKANVVVAKDGSGKYKTIGEALKDIPKQGSDSFIVYIKEGTYNEYLVLEKSMTHVVFVGDGPNKTRITHNKNFVDGTKTIKTATLSVLGDYFMAKDIGIENTSGAKKRQAVALRVQSDESIFYNVRIDGYQDTLYAHTYRQFYRNCTISGTVDFVFGDAAAFFQNCTFLVRKPQENEDCIVTGQGRMERHQSTGIIIHRSRIEAGPEYDSKKNKAYLGRPWKKYSRTIIMETHIGDLIQPKGWVPWKENFGLDTCYYGEFHNEGPGSKVDDRVKWDGIKSISYQRAQRFMPHKFFEADSWIQDTGVPYEPDLHAAPPSTDAGNGDDKDKNTDGGSSPTGAPDSSPSSESESSSSSKYQTEDDGTGESPTPSPSKSSSEESSPSPSPKSDERELLEIATMHDLERMLMANVEEGEEEDGSYIVLPLSPSQNF